MTYLEIDKAIIAITQEKCDECKARLDAIPKKNATEKKAVQLEYGMYTFCGSAGGLFNTYQTREQALRGRQHYFLNRVLHKYPKLNCTYQKLSDEEKMCFIASLQAEIFIRDQWIGKRSAELAAATASGDTKSIFELNIMLSAVKSMFAAWEQWRVANNIFPHMFEGDFE